MKDNSFHLDLTFSQKSLHFLGGFDEEMPSFGYLQILRSKVSSGAIFFLRDANEYSLTARASLCSRSLA